MALGLSHYRFFEVPLLDDIRLVRIDIVAVPPIALALVVEFYILLAGVVLVAGQVLLSELGAYSPRSLGALLGCVGLGTAVGASALSELSGLLTRFGLS